MEHNNRPQGRQKYVSDNSKGVSLRGDGLNTGPVGSGQRPGQQNADYGRRSTRSGGKGSLLALVLLLLLGGGGGSILFGNSDGGQPVQESGYTQSYSTPAPASSSGGASGSSSTAGSYEDLFNSFFGANESPYANRVPNSTGGTSSSSAVKPNSSSVDTTVAPGARAKRTTIYGNKQDDVTIMVYMCGTDLESRSAMATRDLVEMTNAKLGDHVRILAYTGGCTKWNNNIISNQYNQIYQVKEGGLQCLVQNAGSASMTNPDTLASFIQWCHENYPANRNELIFWDHGGGSVSGYGYDQKYPQSGSMSLAGINTALKKAGVSFDFIGFDACLMATVETGLMLDPYADYMIASEETEPGIGWYYTNWLNKLGSDPGMSTLQIGKNIVDDFVSTCATQCQGQSATLSVIDLAELAYAVPGPMKSFSESLSTQIQTGSYNSVSSARSGAREFARSTAIDQIDLVDFTKRLGTEPAAKLAEALRGAVKYNRISSNMSNAYGLSIYFPYRKLNQVDKAVRTYDAIGMDSSYSACIRAFASLEASGQVVSGGNSNPLGSLLGGGYGSYGGAYSGYPGGASASSAYDADMINSLLESFLGGGLGSIYGLDSSNSDFFGRSLPTEATVQYLQDNHFDPNSLVWTENSRGEQVIMLSEQQWALVEDVDLSMYYDTGKGYVDLGLDNTFAFDENGDLLAPGDRTWLAINGQPVAYYHDTTFGEGEELVITGHVPAMLNGERVELLILFDAANPRGTITGARTVYTGGETDTVAKNMTELEAGDRLEFICDFYDYSGSYENSYFLGEPMTVTETMEISNVDVGEGAVSLMYRFTDLYQQHYWTPALLR